MNARQIAAQTRPRCGPGGCGRFLGAGPYGWWMYGEHGTEEGYVCSRCLPGWTPTDGRGRGPEAGYCGVRDGTAEGR